MWSWRGCMFFFREDFRKAEEKILLISTQSKIRNFSCSFLFLLSSDLLLSWKCSSFVAIMAHDMDFHENVCLFSLSLSLPHESDKWDKLWLWRRLLCYYCWCSLPLLSHEFVLKSQNERNKTLSWWEGGKRRAEERENHVNIIRKCTANMSENDDIWTSFVLGMIKI